jgi:preprotein translocase subunit YajC
VPSYLLAPTAGLLPLAADGEGGGGWLTYFPFVIVFVIFYLVVFRPGSKDRKARESALKSLKKHDRVVTNAGIHGIVAALDTDTVTLKVEPDDVRMRFSRAAIWQVNPDSAAAGKTSPTPAEEPMGSGK